MLTVKVLGTTPAGQVALWDTTQPAGEVFMVSGDVAEVALTHAVSTAMARGFLAVVEESAPPVIATPEPTAKPAKPAERKR